MKPVDSDSWFWSPERVNKLFEALKEIATYDEEKYYWHFGHNGLTNQVLDYLRAKGEKELAGGGVGNAITMLVSFGVIERGVPGIKTHAYRRKFYPDKMPSPFTWSHIEQYRGHRSERL